MTRYEQGFLTKCAEYGFDVGSSLRLLKAATLNSRGVLKLLNAFSKTNGKGVDKIIQRAESSKAYLGRLGRLNNEVDSNLKHIANLGRDVKEVVGKPGEEIGNLNNLQARLREVLVKKEYPKKRVVVDLLGEEPPTSPFMFASETPIGRIYQALGFKGVRPGGTLAG